MSIFNFGTRSTSTDRAAVLAAFGVTEEDIAEQEAQMASPQCAWCMVEQGLPLGDGSHGSCDLHAKVAMRLYKAVMQTKR